MNNYIYIDDYDYIKVVAKVYQHSHLAYVNVRNCDVSESARQEIFKFRQKQRRMLFELILRYGATSEQAIDIIDSYIDDELCAYPSHVANAVVKTLGLKFIEKQVAELKKEDNDEDSDKESH